MVDLSNLTGRQRRELAYHKEFVRINKDQFKSVSYELILSSSRRWWNQIWAMYTKLLDLNLTGKKVLVVGSGFGHDALRLAKLGAEVYGIDISPGSLEVAKELAYREKLTVEFTQMTAEKLNYSDNFFECVVMRDILHHVEIPSVLSEIRRVAARGAEVVINEVYTHSQIERFRHSRFIDGFLYPLFQKVIYGEAKPYITEDERKLNEHDLALILHAVEEPMYIQYFDLLMNRVLSSHQWLFVQKIDNKLLNVWPGIGKFFAGRILVVGRVRKL